jgi:hypothetical protein
MLHAEHTRLVPLARVSRVARGPQIRMLHPVLFLGGIITRVDRLRKARPDISFVPRTGGLGKIDSQPGRHCGEECGRVQSHAAIGGLPPKPDILHNVLGFSRTCEDAVRDAIGCRRRLSRSGRGSSYVSIIHSNGFDSPSIVGINSVTVG